MKKVDDLVVLDPKNSSIIISCAGSGKTWLLVSRIFRLLLEGENLSSILAITFTRKAASEMQNRLNEWLCYLSTANEKEVIKFLLDRGIKKNKIDLYKEKCRSLYGESLNNYQKINICTFHSWFYMMVRTTPTYFSYQKDLTIVQSDQYIFEEAWKKLFSNMNRDKDFHYQMEYLILNYQINNTKKLLKNFMKKRLEWSFFFKKKDYELKLEKKKKQNEDIFFKGNGLRILFTKIQKFTLANIDSDSDIFKKINLVTLSDDNLDLFKKIYNIFFTKQNTVRRIKKVKIKSQTDNTDITYLNKSHKSICKDILKFREVLLKIKNYKLNIAAIYCAKKLLKIIQLIKSEKKLIDFLDIEHRAYELLSNSEFNSYFQYKLGTTYKHLLIDEFQDTNPVQWNIIKLWLSESYDSDNKPSIFFVGDPKQSIYSFRGSERRIFDIATNFLKERYELKIYDRNITRRNPPKIVVLLNKLFVKKMQNFKEHTSYVKDSNSHIELIPLIPKSKFDTKFDYSNFNPMKTEPIEDKDLTRGEEAIQIIQKIKSIVGQKLINKGNKMEYAKYSDILILLRKRTQMSHYESVFQSNSIPYKKMYKGGLFKEQEVRDLVSLLKFLYDPSSSFDLAVVLRSPIFFLDNTDLQKISLMDGDSLWLKYKKFIKSKLCSRKALSSFNSLSDWIYEFERKPIHDMLDNILHETNLIEKYKQSIPVEFQDIVENNIFLFIEYILSFNSGRFTNSGDILAEISPFFEGDLVDDLGPSITGVTSNSVLFSTIHGAKGLEFPIVFIADSNDMGKPPISFDIFTNWSENLANVSNFTFFSKQEENTLILKEKHEEIKKNELIEQNNLFYVALTRTKQILIISGNEGKANNSWYQQLKMNLSIDSKNSKITNKKKFIVSDSSNKIMNRKKLLFGIKNFGKKNNIVSNSEIDYGNALHKLFEIYTPPSKITDPGYIKKNFFFNGVDFEKIWNKMLKIINNENLKKFFYQDYYLKAWNEVELSNEIGKIFRIDRLVEFNNELWIIDYKFSTIENHVIFNNKIQIYENQLKNYKLIVENVFKQKPVFYALVFSDKHYYFSRKNI